MFRRSGGTSIDSADEYCVRPPNAIEPRSGVSRPAIARRSVVLPQPNLRYKFTLNSLADQLTFMGKTGGVTVQINGSLPVAGGRDRTAG